MKMKTFETATIRKPFLLGFFAYFQGEIPAETLVYMFDEKWRLISFGPKQ